MNYQIRSFAMLLVAALVVLATSNPVFSQKKTASKPAIKAATAGKKAKESKTDAKSA